MLPALSRSFSLLPKPKFLTNRKAKIIQSTPKVAKATGQPKMEPINHAMVGVKITPRVPPTSWISMASDTRPVKAFEISEFAVGW